MQIAGGAHRSHCGCWWTNIRTAWTRRCSVLAGRDAELVEDRGHVLLDRGLGDELRRRSRRWTALGHRGEHLALARAKHAGGTRHAAPEHPAHDLGVQRPPAHAPRADASMKASTSPTRSLSRYPTPSGTVADEPAQRGLVELGAPGRPSPGARRRSSIAATRPSSRPGGIRTSTIRRRGGRPAPCAAGRRRPGLADDLEAETGQEPREALPHQDVVLADHQAQRPRPIGRALAASPDQTGHERGPDSSSSGRNPRPPARRAAASCRGRRRRRSGRRAPPAAARRAPGPGRSRRRRAGRRRRARRRAGRGALAIASSTLPGLADHLDDRAVRTRPARLAKRGVVVDDEHRAGQPGSSSQASGPAEVGPARK